MAKSPRCPALYQIDQQKNHEGCGQHDGGNGGCTGIIIFFQLDDNQQRRNFRDIGQVSGNKNDGAIFTDASGKGHGKAGDERGCKGW